MNLFMDNPRLVFNRLLEQVGKQYTPKDIALLVDLYRNHFPDIHLYDDVLSFLKQLDYEGIKKGIITDGYAKTQRNKLRALNMGQYFDYIILTDEFGKQFWKPHTLAFEMMKNVLGVEFHEMMYVGDNPQKDFYIGKVYPITTVRIYRNGFYNKKGYLGDIKEIKSVYNLEEISGLL